MGHLSAAAITQRDREERPRQVVTSGAGGPRGRGRERTGLERAVAAGGGRDGIAVCVRAEQSSATTCADRCQSMNDVLIGIEPALAMASRTISSVSPRNSPAGGKSCRWPPCSDVSPASWCACTTPNGASTRLTSSSRIRLGEDRGRRIGSESNRHCAHDVNFGFAARRSPILPECWTETIGWM